MSWFLAAAGIMLLVVLHELGHFAVAKAVGMRVEKFSLFFGPMLVRWRRGETVYGIGPIPLGGYVKISGMNPHEPLPPEVAPRAYFRQPVWKRVVVILAGPAMNLLICFALLWGIFALNGSAKLSSRVAGVERHAPASGALRPGDRIISVDGVRNVGAFANQIASHHCPGTPTAGCRAATPARLVIERDGQRRTLRLTPVYDASLPQPRTRLGFTFGTRTVTEPVGQAAATSGSTMWKVTSGTVSALVRVFYSPQARKNVSGIVGSYEATRQSFELSTARALFVIAVISLSLAVVNLFPFLPLDGGHVFWALAEKVRGRAIPVAVMERVGFVGFALVAFIFIVGLTNDISRLSGPGFGVR